MRSSAVFGSSGPTIVVVLLNALAALASNEIAKTLNNHKYGNLSLYDNVESLFEMKWDFSNDKYVRVWFNLHNISDYSHWVYRFSIRKFNDNEHYYDAKPLNSSENEIIIRHLNRKYIFVVCVTLELATEKIGQRVHPHSLKISLPFMCSDIIGDYEDYLELTNPNKFHEHSLGVSFFLSLFVLFVLFVLQVIFRVKKKVKDNPYHYRNKFVAIVHQLKLLLNEKSYYERRRLEFLGLASEKARKESAGQQAVATAAGQPESEPSTSAEKASSETDIDTEQDEQYLREYRNREYRSSIVELDDNFSRLNRYLHLDADPGRADLKLSYAYAHQALIKELLRKAGKHTPSTPARANSSARGEDSDELNRRKTSQEDTSNSYHVLSPINPVLGRVYEAFNKKLLSSNRRRPPRNLVSVYTIDELGNQKRKSNQSISQTVGERPLTPIHESPVADSETSSETVKPVKRSTRLSRRNLRLKLNQDYHQSSDENVYFTARGGKEAPQYRNKKLVLGNQLLSLSTSRPSKAPYHSEA